MKRHLSSFTTPRGAVELAVVAAVFAFADPTPTSLLVGAAISVAGECLRILAAGYGYSVGELSLRGPYRVVRHPHFLGNALLFLGLCVAGRNPYVTGAALVALPLLMRFEVQRDERRLMHKLGPAYADYRARVPAFLPQLLPLGHLGADNKSFSLTYALFAGRHREFNAVLALAAAFGLLYLHYRLVAKDLLQVAVLAAVGLYLLGRFLYIALVKRPT